MPTQNLMGATSALPLYVNGQVDNVETTYYTCPANSSAKITSATLSNMSADDITVSMSLVSTGETAGDENRVLPPYEMSPGEVITVAGLTRAFLGAGTFVSGVASDDESVTLVMTGVVVS